MRCNFAINANSQNFFPRDAFFFMNSAYVQYRILSKITDTSNMPFFVTLIKPDSRNIKGFPLSNQADMCKVEIFCLSVG